MDTLRWLNDDEFPFLTTPFHPPQVYAPPAGCVISIAKTAVLRPGAQKKAPNFV
ncbi:chemotaxis protein CheW, partial [Klebsiella pneumoniae]